MHFHSILGLVQVRELLKWKIWKTFSKLKVSSLLGIYFSYSLSSLTLNH